MVKIERLPSGSYRARVHLGGGKYKSITGKDKKDVQLRAAQLEADLTSQKPDKPDPMILSEAIENYIKLKKDILSPSTITGYHSIKKNYLQSIMNEDIYSLNQVKIQNAVNEMAASYAPKTVKNSYNLLTKILKTYRPELVLNVTLPTMYQEEVQIPREEDMKKLFKYFYGTPGEVPFALASCCALRASEIMGLTWDKVDFESETMMIDTAIVFTEDGYVKKGAKSRAGKRRIKIFPTVTEILKRHRNDGDGIHVSTITSNGLYRRLCTAQEKLGIEHFKLHALRHYAVSVMLSLDIPIKNIAEYVGHADNKMINRVYGHVMAYRRDEAADKLQDYFSKRISNLP